MESLGYASLGFAPLVPWQLLAAGGAIGLLLVGLALYRRAPGAWLRFLLFAALVLALANPSLVEESRRDLPDLAVVLVDDSASQTLGGASRPAWCGPAAWGRPKLRPTRRPTARDCSTR
jgi:hypothetical protein